MRTTVRAAYSAAFALSFAAATTGAILSACSGDDATVGPGIDAGGSRDATTTDAFMAADTNPPPVDGGPCPTYDAAGLDPNLVTQGKTLVQQLGCANCHQSTPPDSGIVLSGRDMSLVDGGAIYPPNLTPDKVTGLGCWTDPQIDNAILNGVDDQGMKLCVMPKFGNKAPDGGAPRLDDAGATAVIAFLRNLAAVNHQVPETVCPMPMDGGGGSDSGSDAASDAGADAGGDADVDADTDASDAATD